MEKFISIPITTGANQLVSVNDLVGVFAGTAGTNIAAGTATVLTYRNGRTITLNHTSTTAQTAYNMRNAIQDAVVEALKTNWKKPVGYVIPSLPITVASISIATV